MKKLQNLVIELASKIPFQNEVNTNISSSSIGWHIEHSFLVLNGIIETLKCSDPKEYSWKFNFIRLIVMSLKKIPRGKGKAPKVVTPNGQLSSESLQQHFLKTIESLKELETLESNRFFTHPYFGKMKLKQTITFLEIHTQHHLKIAAEITK
jgi:hypothetical protein